MPNRSLAQYWRKLIRSTTFLFAAFVLVGLVLTIITINTIAEAHREIRHQAAEHASALVSVLASDLAAQLQSVDHLLDHVVEQVDPDRLTLPDDWIRYAAPPEWGMAGESMRMLAVLDANGQPVQYLAYKAGVEPPALLPETLEQHREHVMVRPHVSVAEVDGTRIFRFSRPVLRRDGSLAGVVVGIFDPSVLVSALQKLIFAEHDAWLLMRDDGEVLMRVPMGRTANTPEQQLLLRQRYTKTAKGIYDGPSIIDGVERLHAYSQLPNFPLVVLFARDVSRVLAPWKGKAILLGSFAVLLLVALIALGFLYRRDLLRHQQLHRESMRNEAMFRGALRGAGIGTVLYDPDGLIKHINPAACRMLGYEEAELVGTRLLSYAYHDPPQPEPQMRERLLRGEIDFFQVKQRLVRKDGSIFWALVSLSADHTAEPGPVLIAQVQDIDEQMNTENQRAELVERLNETTRALNEEKTLLQVTLANIQDAVITTDVRGKVRFMNPTAESTTGWPLATARGHSLDEVVRLHDLESGLHLPDLVEQCLAHGGLVHQTAILRGHDGARREVEARVAPIRDGDSVTGVVLVYQDVTEARRLVRELLHYAAHDALTNLPNRSAFQVRLEAKLRDARETGRTHALVHLDLDRFKIINDTAGSAAGDAALRQVAATLRTGLREEDVLARLGSDEFGVILHGCSREQAQPIVERMLQALSDSDFPWEDRTYQLTMSAGVTEISPAADSPSILMSEADIASYVAKRAGGNRVAQYQNDQGEALERQRELHVVADLRRALNEDRFALYAQRVIACNNPDELRYELLLRMKDPHNGFIPPDHFVPAAESYEMMSQLDRWVLKQSLERLAPAIAAIPNLYVHINLSANSLNDIRFLEEIVPLLRASPLPGERITFEITETALVSSMSHAARMIGVLRHMGCSVALDDFGTGLSSFNYLRTFPVDMVKIDGMFIHNIAHSVVDRRIAQSIQSIAQVMGARTVAEAVEDATTLEIVHSLQIDYAQGYGLHRPERFEGILKRLAQVQGVFISHPDEHAPGSGR